MRQSTGVRSPRRSRQPPRGRAPGPARRRGGVRRGAGGAAGRPGVGAGHRTRLSEPPGGGGRPRLPESGPSRSPLSARARGRSSTGSGRVCRRPHTRRVLRRGRTVGARRPCVTRRRASSAPGLAPAHSVRRRPELARGAHMTDGSYSPHRLSRAQTLGTAPAVISTAGGSAAWTPTRSSHAKVATTSAATSSWPAPSASTPPASTAATGAPPDRTAHHRPAGPRRSAPSSLRRGQRRPHVAGPLSAVDSARPGGAAEPPGGHLITQRGGAADPASLRSMMR